MAGERDGMPESIQLYVQAIVSGTKADMAYASFLRCEEVVRDLEHYGPHRAPDVPERLYTQLNTSAEDLREAIAEDDSLAYEFGKWRAAVTELEAANAQRLYLLAQTQVTLEELAPRHERPQVVEHLAELLREWIARAWCTSVPPYATDLRVWARRLTWRYDLLPREWRHV